MTEDLAGLAAEAPAELALATGWASRVVRCSATAGSAVMADQAAAAPAGPGIGLGLAGAAAARVASAGLAATAG